MASRRTKLTPSHERAWVGLVRAHDGLLERIEADLKAADLPPLSWYDVLLELSRLRDGRLRQGEIAKRLLLRRYSVSRLVDRMEAEGLVVRWPAADDRRGAVVALTPLGRAMQERMWPVYRAGLQRTVVANLSEDDARTLAELVERLVK